MLLLRLLLMARQSHWVVEVEQEASQQPLLTLVPSSTRPYHLRKMDTSHTPNISVD
jgi:hypothetical protein